MPTITYFQEVVGEIIECECGFESEYIDYHNHSSKITDPNEEWTCPECGKTERLDEDFR
mgnify:CR=1 FL=1